MDLSEELVSTYLQTIQKLPDDIQRRITDCLNSDVQHQRLMTLCEQSMVNLKEAESSETRMAAVDQLIMSILAMQDICDRRMKSIETVSIGVLASKCLYFLYTAFSTLPINWLIVMVC